MGRAPCCDENGLKKGPWTPEEDQKLIEYIQKHGHGSWRALPKNAGLQRCGKSCRLRWTNYLRPDIKRGKFSFEEEQTILQLHAILGNKWSAIAARLPGRTDNEIKNYWNTHLKKRLLQMGIDPVTHRPRTDLFAPHLSHYFSSLSHMSHWESTRLEAEARWLSNYLKLAAAYRVSESANATAMDGFNFLRSGNAGCLKTDDPAAATAMINWGALSSQAQHSQSLEHHQILQAACGTNVAENCGLNSATAPASSSANNILENIWGVGFSSCGYPSLLNQGAAASDSCLTTTTEETHHHNLLSWAAAAHHHDDDDDDNDRYEHNKPASGSLPALLSESSCSAAAAAAFKDKNSRTHAFEESCNHVPPVAVEQVLLLDVSENSKLVASKQNVAALAPAPSAMASCITTAPVATTAPQLWSDVNADEEEGKDYWTNVLKLIDPDTLPAGIEHIIRP